RAVDLAEAETRALADLLGREERLERALDHIRTHAFAGIGDREFDIVAIRQLGVVPEVTSFRRDHEIAALGHGVARVQRQIEHGHLELDLVALDADAVRVQIHVDADRRTDTAVKHIRKARHCAGDVDRRDLQLLGSGEREKLARQTRAALGGLQPGFRPAADAIQIVRPAPDQIEIARDALQQIVEVVRDAAGQLADRLHLLRLPQRVMRLLQLARARADALLQMLVQLAQARFTLPQRRRSPHAFGRLRDDAEHAADASIRLGDRRIGNVEIDGFAKALALDVERPVLARERLAGVADAFQQRLQIVPQLGPVLAGRAAERPRMLVTDGGA